MDNLTPAEIEVANAISAFLYAVDRACPGKTWWEADAFHPAIARALRIDRQEEGGVFALAPFRLWHDGERHLILAAYPAPRILGPVDEDWFGITHVIAWDPRSDAAFVLGDPEPQTVGLLTDETPTLYGSARAFFTDWMRARAAFFVRWCESRRGEWAHGATEHDLAPGALAIGDVDAIRWRPSAMPENLACVGLDAGKLNRALLRAARVPRAYAASQNLRNVA